jgi:hypothetical protein
MAGAKLCLKARPTPSQLADRLRPMAGLWPDGLELYLAAADLHDAETLDTIAARITSANVPDGFVWLIEGPVDSLDGGDFDVTRESAADVQVIEKLAHLAERIGAQAVNIHLIAPSTDLRRLNLTCRQGLLTKAVPFLAQFTRMMHDAGAVPTIENMPPVLRMRRSDFAFTPIGMCAADLRFAVEHVPGLRVLADTSHAGLYLNARHLAPDTQYAWSGPLKQYLEELPPDGADLAAYLVAIPALENAQISDASGVLGEGLAYGEGDLDLDSAIAWLGANARHIVTETLEADNDDAVLMRDALRRMRVVLS